MGLGQIRWSRARTPSRGFCFPSKAGRGTGLFLQKVRSAPSKSSPGFVPPCSHLVSGSEKSWPVGIKQRNAWKRVTEHKSRDRRRPRLPLLRFENRAEVGQNQALGLPGRGAQECRESQGSTTGTRQPRKTTFSAKSGCSGEQGIPRAQIPSTQLPKGFKPRSRGQRAGPGSAQPPEGAPSRRVLEGNGRAAGSGGGGFCRGRIATPGRVLITPPGQGQLEVKLLQILALQARAQLPGGVLLVWLRAKGPVCNSTLVRNLPGAHPPSVPSPAARGPECPPTHPRVAQHCPKPGSWQTAAHPPARSWARSLMRCPTMA